MLHRLCKRLRKGGQDVALFPLSVWAGKLLNLALRIAPILMIVRRCFGRSLGND